MTEKEKKVIAVKFERGQSATKIAQEHYISKSTVYRITKEMGVQREHKNGYKKEGLIQMMMNDWNAGMPTARMARVYNYSCERSLLNSIRYYRKKGYNFKTRKAGRKKKHGNQDTVGNRPGNNTERICDNGYGDVQATGFRQAAE